MISVEAARALIQSTLAAAAPVRVPLAQAAGRILRAPLFAAEDSPAFDRSAMDGYALPADDPAERFRVVGEVAAGSAGGLVVGAGECARIFTGAPLPAGTTQVLKQELARREGDWMIPERRESALHIRRRGEDYQKGALLIETGSRVGACEAALLAQVGSVEVTVSAAPRVLHLVTGGELVSPEEIPREGQIRDTNSILVATLLRKAGADLIGQARCGDDLEKMMTAIGSVGDERWDLLLVSGGASVGDYDFGARALRELGFVLHFERLNLRPGKPLIFATRGRQGAFVLPGNPVSHFVTFELAVRLALECLAGGRASWPIAEVLMATALPAQADPRATYWPASVRSDGGVLRAWPRAWSSSGDLGALAGANALLEMLPGSGPLAAGAMAKCLLLDLA